MTINLFPPEVREPKKPNWSKTLNKLKHLQNCSNSSAVRHYWNSFKIHSGVVSLQELNWCRLHKMRAHQLSRKIENLVTKFQIDVRT